jgi:hypothetical protein
MIAGRRMPREPVRLADRGEHEIDRARASAEVGQVDEVEGHGIRRGRERGEGVEVSPRDEARPLAGVGDPRVLGARRSHVVAGARAHVIKRVLEFEGVRLAFGERGDHALAKARSIAR